MDIREELKNRRKELGLTMLEVANKVGVSEATISRWESGDIANMRRDKIVLLAKALKVTPAYLMGWEEEEASFSADPKTTGESLPAYSLNDTEKKILKNCKELNKDGQEKLLDNSIDLVASGRYKTEYAEEYSPAAKLAAYGGDNFAEWEEEPPKGTF